MRDAVALITESVPVCLSVMVAIPLPVTGGCGWKRSPALPSQPRPDPARYYRPEPGHGPGVSTSGSSSTFVSKSRKPRRR